MLEILSTGLSKIVVGLTALLFTMTSSPEVIVNVPHDNAPPPLTSPTEPTQTALTPTDTQTASTSVQTTPPQPEVENEISFIDTSTAHLKLRESLVNVYCTLRTTKRNVPLTASGVVIDPRGVVLTNAHVAQYVLLKDFVSKDAIKCSIRTGSPAVAKYEAKILYISPEWIERHAEDILSSAPEGTGRDDYAFLLIGESLDDEETRPDSFEFTTPTLTEELLLPGAPILLGAYPAGIFDPLSIEKVLYAQTLKTTIKKLLTFDKKNVDLISTGGTYLSQTGSSGGAVLDKNGFLAGIFVTSTQKEDFEERDLRAITMTHINRSLREYAGLTIPGLLAGEVEKVAREFDEDISPILAEILLEEIDRN
jgi:hypothetical protein